MCITYIRAIRNKENKIDIQASAPRAIRLPIPQFGTRDEIRKVLSQSNGQAVYENDGMPKDLGPASQTLLRHCLPAKLKYSLADDPDAIPLFPGVFLHGNRLFLPHLPATFLVCTQLKG